MEKIERSAETEKYLKRNLWRIPLPIDLVLVSSAGLTVAMSFRLGIVWQEFVGKNYQGYEILGDIIFFLIYGIGVLTFLGFIYISSGGVRPVFVLPRNILIFGQIIAALVFPEIYFSFNIIAISISIAIYALLYLVLLWISLEFPRAVNYACAYGSISFMLLFVVLMLISPLFRPSKEEREARNRAEAEKFMAEYHKKFDKLKKKHFEMMKEGKGNIKEFEKDLDQLIIDMTD